MKIQIDDIVRDMTPEEIVAYEEWQRATPPPDADEALTRYANSITGANDPDLISAAETLTNKYAESKEKAEAYDILMGVSE